MLQNLLPGLKKQNAEPRAVGDPAAKATKKRLADMADDSAPYRLPQADRASVHLRQLVDLSVTRMHKPRAYTVFFDRLPPIAARVADQAAEDLEERHYECLPPISGPRDDGKPRRLCI